MVYKFSGRFALTTLGVKMLGAMLMAPFQLSLLIVLAFLLTYVPASSALPSFSHSYILTTRQQPGAGDADLTVLPNGKMFFCEAAGSYVQDPQAYQVTDGPATACLGTLSENQSRKKPSAAFLQHLKDDLFSLQVDSNLPLFSCTNWKNSGLGSSD